MSILKTKLSSSFSPMILPIIGIVLLFFVVKETVMEIAMKTEGGGTMDGLTFILLFLAGLITTFVGAIICFRKKLLILGALSIIFFLGSIFVVLSVIIPD